VGGAGGGFYEAAAAQGCDALVTAEVKHHHFLEAEALGLTLVDAGHFHTERFVVERFEALIGAGCPGLAIHRSRTVDRDLVQTISSY